MIKSVFRRWPHRWSRPLTTLAIESSCDDASVALLERCSPAQADGRRLVLHFHETVTANNARFSGIHPLNSAESVQRSLPGLVRRALSKTAELQWPNIDFLTVTRGPGMRSSLSAGIDLAKGLSVAWNDLPLIGVHHMQAHALTPRLVSAMNPSDPEQPLSPSFPYLSVLVSGGHSMLLSSASLTEHKILASTVDIAIGDLIDKVARMILPSSSLPKSGGTNYGPLLEAFAFPQTGSGNAAYDYKYEPPKSRADGIALRPTKWGWSIRQPFADNCAGDSLRLSFTGIGSTVKRIIENGSDSDSKASPRQEAISNEELVDLAREAMRVSFEHVASRVVQAIQRGALDGRMSTLQSQRPTVVVSGGVASNQFLRHLLRSFLDARGYEHIALCFPPAKFCCDNAAMIGWTGIEMWKAGWLSEPDFLPLKKWSFTDEKDGHDGILQVDGWKRRS